jgi:uncharacterized protein
VQALQYTRAVLRLGGNGFLPPDSGWRPPSAARRVRWAPAGAVAGALALALTWAAAPRMGPQQEVAWLSRLAQAGDRGAQLQLGLAYREGRKGLVPSAAMGLHWLERSAAGGNAYAADLVGNAYAAGLGTKADLTRARYWWRVAARRGSADAQRRLGEGLAASGRPKAARSLLRRAADQGDPQAMRGLRSLYAAGQAPAADLERGQDGLDTWAARLHSPTMAALAGTVDLLAATGTGGQSGTVLKRRAETGDPQAAYQLAMRYRDGSWGVLKDPGLSRYWLGRAAAAGNPLAIKALSAVE